MDIIANWLAMLPAIPDIDEYGRPWALCHTRGMTPAQQRYFAALKEQAVPSSPPAQDTQAQTIVPCNNGVVDDTHLYMMHAGKIRRVALPAIENLGDLLRLCFDHGLDAVWVLTETALSERATSDFMIAEQWEIKRLQYQKGSDRLWDDGKKRATFVKAWKKPEYRDRRPGATGDQGRAVHIGYAEHETSYQFDQIKHPVSLLAAVAYLEYAIDTPLRFSAQSTGLFTIQKHIKRPDWIAPVSLPAQATTQAASCTWRRAGGLTEEEIAQDGRLVTADKNSQYMAGGTSARLGEGNPEYMTGAQLAALNGKLPTGIYHIELSGESQFDGLRLPHPTEGHTDTWSWVYTTMLASDLGYHVHLKEGYIWQKSHVVLRPWAENLWAGRAGLKTNDAQLYRNEEGRLAAYHAINTVIRGGLGMLDHPPEYDTDFAKVWYRPDWYALLVDLSKSKMFYVILKYIRDYNIYPIGVLVDCLYYLGKTDNHAQELPGMYDRAGKLGGFKRKFDKPVTVAQLAPLFANPRVGIEEINRQLLAYDRGAIELGTSPAGAIPNVGGR